MIQDKQNIRPWGRYDIVKQRKIIKIKPNQELSLQYHENREEFWVIAEGKGIIIKDKEEIECKKGDKFHFKKGTVHRAKAFEEGLVIKELSKGIVDEEDIIRLEDKYGRVKKQKLRVAVSGYFDPLHVGHLEMMKKAKDLGDILIVIVNNDKQAKLKKGKSYMSEEDRIKIIESLKIVDEVVLSIDEDSSVCKTLEKVSPDVFAKGGDRYIEEIPETLICREKGIKIIDRLGKKIKDSSKIMQGENL